MSLFEDTFQEECQIYHISNLKDQPKNEKESMIQDVKRNISTDGNSNLKTILSIANNNFGFSLLVYGINVDTNGLYVGIPCILIAWFVGIHSASMMVKHFMADEADYPDIVGRVIGKKSKLFYALTSLIYLLFLNMLYYIYATDMTYSVINFILDSAGKDKLPSKDIFTLSNFSYQWIGIILIVCYLCFFQMKSLSFFIKLSPLGLLAVLFITVYSIIMGFINIGNASLVFKFDFDIVRFARLIGIFTTGFYSHAFLFPVIKKNREFQDNMKCTNLGFALTGTTYLIASTFGAFAIAGKSNPEASSIYDYFADSWITIFLRLMILVQLSTVLPIVMFIMRTQFWSAILPGQPITPSKNNIVNLFYALISLSLQMFNVSPSSMISLAGALGGYFGIYIFAPLVHFLCMHHQWNDYEKETTIKEDSDISDYGRESSNLNKAFIPKKHNCKSFHQQEKSPIKKSLSYSFHGILFLFGSFILIVKLIDIFS